MGWAGWVQGGMQCDVQLQGRWRGTYASLPHATPPVMLHHTLLALHTYTPRPHWRLITFKAILGGPKAAVQEAARHVDKQMEGLPAVQQALGGKGR